MRVVTQLVGLGAGQFGILLFHECDPDVPATVLLDVDDLYEALEDTECPVCEEAGEGDDWFHTLAYCPRQVVVLDTPDDS